MLALPNTLLLPRDNNQTHIETTPGQDNKSGHKTNQETGRFQTRPMNSTGGGTEQESIPVTDQSLQPTELSTKTYFTVRLPRLRNLVNLYTSSSNLNDPFYT